MAKAAWGESSKDMKSKVYPTVIGVLCLAIVLLLVGRFQVEVGVEPTTSEKNTVEPVPLPSPSTGEVAPSSPPNNAPLPQEQAAVAIATPGNTLPITSDTTYQGSLRVSNQSAHPIRVALLTQPSEPSAGSSAPPTERQLSFQEPAHWDFAPGEGSRKGLILSLPENNLQLKKGDVVVAFAQDGSRRYWGPYVVGETSTPAWNNETSEWQLVLQP